MTRSLLAPRTALVLAAVPLVAAGILAPAGGAADPRPLLDEETVTSAQVLRTTLVRTPGLTVRADSQVTAGQRIVVRGRAKHHRAALSLQRRTARRWVVVHRVRTSARGTFGATTRVHAPGLHTFRVVVTPTQGRALSATFRVTVLEAGTAPVEPTPTTTPTTTTPTITATPTSTATPTTTATPPPTPTPTTGLGDPSHWSYIGSDDPIAWNSCTPITWSYAPVGEYAGGLGDMTRAVAAVSARSGLQFTYVGSGGGKLHVDWSDAVATPDLEGGVVGIGGPTYYFVDPAKNGGVRRLIISGRVTLDREEQLPTGFPTSEAAGWGQVMVHEVMHAVGLGHTIGPEQIMYPSVGAFTLGAGDHTGLFDVGSSRGCLEGRFDRTSPPRGGEVLVLDAVAEAR